MKPYLESELYVPDEGNPSTAKLWIIGESPGYDEVMEGKPFIGKSGELLRATLASNNISLTDVFLTNLCHYRPKGNKFELLKGSEELAEGISDLTHLLLKYKPNLIVALGAHALYFLTKKHGIAAHRGSVLASDYSGIKCIPSYHPAYVLRDSQAFPIFQADFNRIAREYQTPVISAIKWDFTYGKDSTLPALVDSYESAEYLAVDIESVKESTTIICVGFARSGTEAISIPLETGSDKEQIQRLLLSKAKKIFHFGTFDVTMLRLNGFTVENYTDDTIIAAHVLEPELPRDLGYVASIYTDIPAYKEEGRSNIPADTKGWSLKRNKEDLYIYNCKDVCATYLALFAELKDLRELGLEEFYRYEMEVVGMTIEMGLNGMLRDSIRHRLIQEALLKKQALLQQMLNVICGTNININSPKQMATVLYSGLKLPTRKNQEGKVTADNDALVSLISHIKTHLSHLKTTGAITEWKMKLAFVEISIKMRGVSKMLSSYFNIEISEDNRVRSTYKVAGTESGRLSASKFVDGTGLNSQTIPREALEL